MTDDGRPAEYVQSLDRGLAVIRAFSAAHPRLSVTQVAERTGMNRAATRRFLITLAHLGFVRSDGRTYWLGPRVLELGYSYLSSVHPWDTAYPLMEALSTEIDENVLAGVLEGADIVCVSRTSRRSVTVAVFVGGRVPAVASSMGRVIMAYSPQATVDAVLAAAQQPRGNRPVLAEPDAVREELALIREQGWSLVEGGLDEGLLSLSAPVFGTDSRVVAALNISAHGNRLTRDDAEQRIAPALIACAGEISHLFRAG